MMALTRLGHEPGSQNETDWHAALGNAFAAVRGQVCSACGLGGVGHAPESKWLGFDPHPFAGVPADSAMLARANELTSAAYQARA